MNTVSLSAGVRMAALMRIGFVGAIVAAAPSSAQDQWNYRATLYGWFPGVSTTVETPLGELETEVDFDEIFDSLDLAFLGSLEARNGRWSLIADLQYFDLSSEVATPFGAVFSRGDVDTQMTLVSAYAAYALMDQDNVRLDVGGGLRYTDAAIDTRLIGQEAVSDAFFTDDGGWADLLVGARVSGDFTDQWYGVAYVDVGGFGIGDSADLTWQGFAGVGYRFNETWTTLGGYRHLSIDREFGQTGITSEVSGPYLGAQISF